MSDTTESVPTISQRGQSIIDSVKLVLGYPVISIFLIDEQILKVTDIALRKCTEKACVTSTYLAYNGSGMIDLTQLDASCVKAVYKADLTGGSCVDCGAGCDICEKLCNYRWYSELTKGSWNNQIYDQLAYQYALSELRSLQTSDYYLDGNLLYLDNYDGLITIEYVKKNPTLDDLDSYFYSWVENYTIAMCKIIEGRIRSKYKLSSGVFEVESDELISEGNTDKQELEEKLNDYIGYWTVM